MKPLATLRKWKDRIFDHPLIFDLVREFMDPSENSIRQILKRRKSDETRILDIGCGTGRLLVLASDSSVNWVGIDLDEHFLSYLNSKSPENASLALMSADHLGFRDSHFDIAIMLDVTHHLSDPQVVATLCQAKRIADKRVLVIDQVKVTGSVVRDLFYKLDRGAYIRTFSELKELMRSVADIEEASLFCSGFYIKCCVSLATDAKSKDGVAYFSKSDERSNMST
jgi:ubiquinone/menaquinone biosynthesis C-methylase UbiE